MATLFTRIINREIPADFVYEDENVVAFRDIAPEAPVHIVICTRNEILNLTEIKETGDHLAILNAVQKIAASEGLTNGFRLVFNAGEDGGQTIPHLHAHLLGGRKMGWPPG